MPASPIVQLLILFGLAGVAFAAWKGRAPERIAAAVVAANLILGLLFQALTPETQGSLRFANDGLAALVLLGVTHTDTPAITIRYGAPWMGGVMLFYAAQFSLHSFYMVTGRSNAEYLHALINNVIFASIVWCLIIGTAVAWYRRVRTARAATT